MADQRPPFVEEEGERIAGATVESPPRDREAENTEQEQAPENPVEEQQVCVSLLCAALESHGQCTWPAVIPCQICQLVAVSDLQ